MNPYNTFKQKPFPRKHSMLEHLFDFAGINRFFLREGKRPHFRTEPNRIASPVQGKLVEVQTLNSSKPVTGKQTSIHTEFYSFEDIVHNETMRDRFENGVCINIYLSPMDWHYVLAPLDWTVQKLDYHPNFCRPILFMKSGEITNERLVLYGRSSTQTPVIIVLIGSFLVAGLECIAKEGDVFKTGDLLGGFKLGSTVMMLFPRDCVQIEIPPKTKLLPGEPIGRFIS